MNLAPGAQLGPYTILCPIGAGGMGEVYLARDGKLQRNVAIKLLPAAFCEDPEYLRRFEQEAKTVGSLNHPNILTVFDLHTHGGAPLLVMEFLEGETLRAKLGGKTVPIKKALDWSLQFALGLAAAHEKGVVHRDLKPENLFITKNGRLKILDFGLAKVHVQPLGDGSRTRPLNAAPETEPGALLGTVGYMSPEQVRGEHVDVRSDIFSFGVILWEMLSGRPPFARCSAIETLHAILKDDPPQLDADLKIPPTLERILQSCLAKDPVGRFHSAHDLAFALEGCHLDSPVGSALPIPSSAGHSFRTLALSCLAGAAVVLLLGGLALKYHWPPFQAPDPPKFHRLTYQQGDLHSARFSPDGLDVVFSATWYGRATRVYTTRLGNLETRSLWDREAFLASASPTGELALLENCRSSDPIMNPVGILSMARPGAGDPRPVAREVSAAEHHPSGEMAAVLRRKAMYVLEYPLGKMLRQSPCDISNLRFSPDGKRLAYVEHPLAMDSLGRVMVQELDTGKSRILSKDFDLISGLAWKGKEIWFSGSEGGTQGSLFAVDQGGNLRRVLNIPGNLRLHDLSKDGRLLLSRGEIYMGALVWKQGSDHPLDFSIRDWTAPMGTDHLGRRVLLTDSGTGALHPGPEWELYFRPMDGLPPVHLGRMAGSAALSPEGTQVAVHRANPPRIVLAPLEAGESRSFPLPTLRNIMNLHWEGEGESLILKAQEGDRPPRTFRMNLRDGSLAPLTPEGVLPHAARPGYSYQHAALSLDGSRLIVDSPEGVAIFDLPTRRTTPLPGLEPGELVAGWNSDSRSVFVYRAGRFPLTLLTLDIVTGRRQGFRTLAPPAYEGLQANLEVHAGGRAIVAGYYRLAHSLYMVEGLK